MTNILQIYTLYQLQPGLELEFKKGARLLKAEVLTFTSINEQKLKNPSACY